MALFRTLAYLSPLAAGLGVAAALAVSAGRPPARRARAAALVLGAVLGVLALAGVLAQAWLAVLQVSALLLAFSVLVAGVFLLGESCRLPPEASQLAASLAALALLATPFLLGPVVGDAEARGLGAEAIARRIDLLLDASPLMVMGYSIFGEELLHTPFFYATRTADFQHDTPRWTSTGAAFGAAGLLLAGLGPALRLLRRKAPGT
jgi:hypothetical protein